MRRRLNLKLELPFNRASRAEPGKQSPTQQSIGLVRTLTGHMPPASPEEAMKRLVADPNDIQLLESAADALAKAENWAYAKAFYAACLEERADEVIEEKLREITAIEAHIAATPAPWRDDRFIYDPNCGIESAVMAAIG